MLIVESSLKLANREEIVIKQLLSVQINSNNMFIEHKNLVNIKELKLVTKMYETFSK